MKIRTTVMGVGVAGLMAAGLAAQTQTQYPTHQTQTMTTTEIRKVTAKGCLERDAGAGTMASTAFKLTDVDIIKDEPYKKDDPDKSDKSASNGYGSSTGSSTTTSSYGVGAQADQQNQMGDKELRVLPAADSHINLDAQVNHKVELVGMMSNTDLTLWRKGTSGATDPQMKPAPITFKATSVKSLSDKCD